MLLGFGGCLPSGGAVNCEASKGKLRWKPAPLYKSLKVASTHARSRHFEWSYIAHIVGDNPNPDIFDAVEILPGEVWLGSAMAAVDARALQERNIRYVFTIAKHLVDTVKPEHQVRFISDHAVLEIDDYPSVDLLSHLDESLQWIDKVLKKNKGAVLIHCAKGISRSVSVCIAYLMSRKNMTMDSAMRYVSMRRAKANPNSGFRMQLKQFEEAECNGMKAFQESSSRSPITV